MKIFSWNVNGIRSIMRKNFLKWFEKEKPDILCIQEIKADEESIPEELLKIEGYHSYFNHARKKGYSGVCVYTKEKPLRIRKGLGIKGFDDEGRALILEYKEFTLMNLYLPYGGRDKSKLPYKLRVYDEFLKIINKWRSKPVILCGDFNIAHKEIDLARPKSNKNNIMFSLEERKRIDEIISKDFIDSFREYHSGEGHYSFWSYMHNSRERNIGWRIDYVFISRILKDSLKNAFILKDVHGSDHCPIGITLFT